jgi:hypothetical protein
MFNGDGMVIINSNMSQINSVQTCTGFLNFILILHFHLCLSFLNCRICIICLSEHFCAFLISAMSAKYPAHHIVYNLVFHILMSDDEYNL